MAFSLTPEDRKFALASLERFCTDELELEASGIQVAQLLDFILKEIAPTVYNTGVADSQAFIRARLADLEATCYEAPFTYWPKGSMRKL